MPRDELDATLRVNGVINNSRLQRAEMCRVAFSMVVPVALPVAVMVVIVTCKVIK